MLSPQARFSRRSRQPAYNCRCNYIYKGAHVLATMVILQARLTAPHNFRAFAAKMPARLNSRTLPESWLKLTSSRPLQGGASHWCSQTCSWTCITTGIQAHQGSSFRKAPRRVPRGMEDVHQNDEGMLMWAASNHVDECVTLTSSHSSCLRTSRITDRFLQTQRKWNIHTPRPPACEQPWGIAGWPRKQNGKPIIPEQTTPLKLFGPCAPRELHRRTSWSWTRDARRH